MVDDDLCPPDGHIFKEQTTGLWSGGCAIPVNDAGSVKTQEVPLTCLLLADPGLGAQNCPVCTQMTAHSFNFSKHREQTASAHQLLEQAENNLKLLVQLGVKSLSELSESPKFSKEWVRFGTTFNSLGYPLPVDFRERLEKFYVEPRAISITTPPPAPETQISTFFGSVSPDTTSREYDLNWTPKPTDLKIDARLKGSLPAYLLDHIPGAEHYNLIDQPDETGRVHYTTPDWKSPRLSSVHPERRVPQPDEPKQPTKEVKEPLNVNAVAFVPFMNATPQGPPGSFLNQQIPNEVRTRGAPNLPEPHITLPTRRDWKTPPHQTVTHPPQPVIHTVHPPVAHPVNPPNLPAPGTWNPYHNAAYINSTPIYPTPTSNMAWNMNGAMGLGNALGVRPGNQASQQHVNNQYAQFGNGAHVYPYPHVGTQLIGYGYAPVGNPYQFYNPHHQPQGGQFPHLPHSGFGSGIPPINLATSFAVAGRSLATGVDHLGRPPLNGSRGENHVSDKQGGQAHSSHQGHPWSAFRGNIQGVNQYQHVDTGLVPTAPRLIPRQAGYRTRADRNAEFDRGNQGSRGGLGGQNVQNGRTGNEYGGPSGYRNLYGNYPGSRGGSSG